MRAAALLLLAVPAAAQDLVRNPHVTISLVPETWGLTPGRPLRMALRFDLEPGWHVYWENPGESGIATTAEWRLPDGVRAEPLRYPVPERLVVAGVVTHVHHGQPVFTTALHHTLAGGTVSLGVTVRYGICREVCVPGAARLAVRLPVSDQVRAHEGWTELAARGAFREPDPGLAATFSVLGDTALVELRPATGCLRGPVTLFVREREVAPASVVHRGGRRSCQGVTIRLPLTGRPDSLLTGVAVVGAGPGARAWRVEARRRQLGAARLPALEHHRLGQLLAGDADPPLLGQGLAVRRQ